MWPPLTGDQIVAKAREYIGTPWHHDARIQGVGVDCVGLLVCVLRDLGVEVQDVRGYGFGDEFGRMTAAMERHARPLAEGEATRAGDVLLFRNVRLPLNWRMLNHCGIANGQGGMVHAWNASAIQAVTENALDGFWERALAARYRYFGTVEA